MAALMKLCSSGTHTSRQQQHMNND